VAKFASAGGDLVFAPAQAQIYPPGFATMLSMSGPATAGLEDRFRPTHFSGVATIVAKLFNQCRPDAAIFGEKDYQQLKVVERMACDLDFETAIIGVPTVREQDGLALSSRNVYLSAKERAAAPALYAALRQCAIEIDEGGAIETALDRTRKTVTAAGFAIDYIEARHAETLAPLASREAGQVRLLAAATLGKTRLIDNIGL
jgi:pantoate--beta-alanine ligase